MPTGERSSCSIGIAALIALSLVSACRESGAGHASSAAASAGAGQSPAPSPAPSPALSLTIGDRRLTAPATMSPGWTRVHLGKTEDRHIVVLFRLPATATEQDVHAFVAALDSAPATPSPAVAVGGPELGADGDVIVQFTAGRYVAACVRRGEDKHRHALAGEYATIDVTPAASGRSAVAPASSQTVTLMDFAYGGATSWSVRDTLLRVENTGKQDHQVRLVRLRDGVTMSTWANADDPDTLATTVAGMARLGAGETAYLPVRLERGTYVVYCLVADQVTRRPHIELGMLREIKVSD